MSHHIYHTDAFVVGHRIHGEANKHIKLFTRELGFVTATAQGIRHARSKLRYSLQDYSFSSVALVRGKEIWRITNAIRISNIKNDFKDNKDLFMVFARVFALLERLIGGEERHEKLFMLLHDALVFFKGRTISPDIIRNAEYLIVLRLLHELGYVGDIPACRSFLVTTEWSDEVLSSVSSVESEFLSVINNSIKESQL
jgi:DNA repair protein RecO